MSWKSANCTIIDVLMASRPKFKLSRLRAIGWSLWDPIGLKDVEDWPEDEYDGYLLHAAFRLWGGTPEIEVAEYLVRVETELMGLDATAGVQGRALRVVSALASYTAELNLIDGFVVVSGTASFSHRRRLAAYRLD